VVDNNLVDRTEAVHIAADRTEVVRTEVVHIAVGRTEVVHIEVDHTQAHLQQAAADTALHLGVVADTVLHLHTVVLDTGLRQDELQ